MNQLGGLLQQYATASATQAPETVDHDFDEIAQVAPKWAIADGLAQAFRSDQTPAFGQMAAQLFDRSSKRERASIINTLISTLGPAVTSQILGRTGSPGPLGGLSGGQAQVTPEQAEQISPGEVNDLASEAVKRDPSIIDRLSDFYAEHPTLIKTLGAPALAITLSNIAQRQSGT
jgi:hypothetical protein